MPCPSARPCRPSARPSAPLGAVAYYLVTGRPPFDGRDGIGVMIAHARDPVVPPSRGRADVPKDLKRVVMRCLAKDPLLPIERAR
jgi:serine/threonine protein kinase